MSALEQPFVVSLHSAASGAIMVDGMHHEPHQLLEGPLPPSLA